MVKKGCILNLDHHMVLCELQRGFSAHVGPSAWTAVFRVDIWAVSVPEAPGQDVRSLVQFLCLHVRIPTSLMPLFLSLPWSCSCVLSKGCFVENTEEYLATNAVSP